MRRVRRKNSQISFTPSRHLARKDLSFGIRLHAHRHHFRCYIKKNNRQHTYIIHVCNALISLVRRCANIIFELYLIINLSLFFYASPYFCLRWWFFLSRLPSIRKRVPSFIMHVSEWNDVSEAKRTREFKDVFLEIIHRTYTIENTLRYMFRAFPPPPIRTEQRSWRAQ